LTWPPGLPDGFFSNQKSRICVSFGGSSNGRCCYILCPFGQFSGHFAYVMAIWYILHRFSTFLSVLVCCFKKNLATLLPGLHSSLGQKFLMARISEIRKSIDFFEMVKKHRNLKCKSQN
jgi:hypothetical protein